MALKDDLSAAMKLQGDDAQAGGIADAIADYVSDLKVTADSISGTVSGGSFSGAVTDGSMEIDASIIKSALLSAASTMSSMTAGGDAVLAAAFNTGLMAAIPKWNLPILGTTTPPAPASPFPSGDAGTAICIFNPAPVVTKMAASFAAMGGMTSGGDDKYAGDLADAIKDFYTKPVQFTIQGTTVLAGAQGDGKISE